MKIIRYLFAIYIAVLSVSPCYKDDCVGELSIVNDQGQNKHDKDGPCTPFCISACCASHVFCSPRVELVTFIPRIVSQHFIHTPAFVAGVIMAIWQPPKLV